ncbi:uroporphyrinogen-III synthase [Microvirga sp. P5_D2]
MRVLLTRPQAQLKELGAVLEGQGIEWLGEPLLRIVSVPWDPGVLVGKQALLLTSANASRELLRVPGIRRDMPIHAVGPGTAAPLLAEGFSGVQAAGGTAMSLITHVRQHVDPRAGRLLHLSGLDITLDLAVDLASAGFAVDRVVVYRAAAMERLSEEVMREISRNRVDAAVFLSARTAATFCNLVIASGTADACARMTAVAISRKVASALFPAGFGRVFAAETPSIDSVVDAVLRVTCESVQDPP